MESHAKPEAGHGGAGIVAPGWTSVLGSGCETTVRNIEGGSNSN